MVLVASVFLVVSSQANASTTLSIQVNIRSDFTERNSLISFSALRGEMDLLCNEMESGMTTLFSHVVRLKDSIAPNQSDKSWGHNPIILKSSSIEWPPILIPDMSNMTIPLLQHNFVTGAGFKNTPNPGVTNRRLFGISDDRQWAIVELNLAANSVPAPAALLIGSIGVGIIGWMRTSKTYTI
jgi:hypothetical protein